MLKQLPLHHCFPLPHPKFAKLVAAFMNRNHWDAVMCTLFGLRCYIES